MNRIALVALLGALAAGCNQQATADLAVCKSDLTEAQAEVQAANAAKSAAEAKVVELEQTRQQLADQVAQYEKAASDADAAASAKADAAKSKSAAHRQAVKKAAEKADVKPVDTTPVKDMTKAQKKRALGY